MIFWDTSALIPLIIDEPGSARAREQLERDDEIVVWWATEIECWSALSRSQREGRISSQAEEHASVLLNVLRESWFEISPSDEVRREARRLVRIHSLRAGDALQLGAALVWAGRYEGHDLITNDERMREAARLEGFRI